jgi:Phage integrase family
MLADVIEAYLTRQRSLGMRFDSAGQLLRRFGRAIGERPIQEVTPEAILDFLNGRGALTATWTLKHKVLTGLYRFAVSRGYVDNSPLPTTQPKLPPQQTPYVYSNGELRRLLEATTILRAGHSRHVPAMYRTLILLLYGTGMRIGEALRLTLQDVDLTERVITSTAQSSSRRVWFRSDPGLPPNWRRTSSAAACRPCRSQKQRRSSRPAAFEDGAIRASSRCSSTCDEPPVSTVLSANRVHRAYMIFATPRPCTVSLHGIAPARTSSDCFHSSLPTLVTSISDRPSATSK